MDVQVALWEAMAAQGCDKVVDVCETHNIPALKLHIRMSYHEQGRVTHVYGLFGRWRFYRESRYQGSRLDPLRKPGRPVVSAAAQASFGRKTWRPFGRHREQARSYSGLRNTGLCPQPKKNRPPALKAMPDCCQWLDQVNWRKNRREQKVELQTHQPRVAVITR